MYDVRVVYSTPWKEDFKHFLFVWGKWWYLTSLHSVRTYWTAAWAVPKLK